MYRSITLAISFCLVAIMAIESHADQADLTRVILRTTLAVDGPNGSSLLSNTSIAPLDRDDTKQLSTSGYSINLVVTDRRLNEFSIYVSVENDDGTPLDSSTVLVAVDREATFEFKSGNDKISGTIQLEQIIERMQE
jgi:hypothetical protein